jgi:hypothetical protein
MSTTSPRRRTSGPFERSLEPPAPEAVFQDGVYLPLDQLDLSGTGGPAVVLNGNLSLSWVDSTFEATLDACAEELEEAAAQVGLRGAVTLELAMDADADVAGSLRLATVPLPPFTIGAITVSPFITVRLLLAAATDADVRFGLVAPFEFGSGFTFDGTTSSEELTSSPRHAPEVGLPDTAATLTASAELEISLALMLTVGAGLPIGGPALGASFGTLLSIDPVAGVDVDGVVQIAGGWVFPGLDGLPDIPAELPVLHPVARSDILSIVGPLTPGGVSTRWSRRFDIPVNESAAAVIPAGDGLAVVAGGVSGAIAWLAALDPDGVPTSQHTSGPNDLWRPVGMAHAPGGDVLVAGQDDGIRLDLFSPTGERRWTRTYTVPDTAQTLCIAMTARSAGGAVLAGQVLRGSSRIPLLVGVDVDGDVDFAMEIDPGVGATDARLAGLAETRSGDVLAVGEVDVDPADPQNPFSVAHAWILRLHPDTALDGYALGGTRSTIATRVVADADGSYAVGGRHSPAVGAANTTWLAALDAADGLRWSSSYRVRPEVPSLEDVVTGLATLDGRLLACGRMDPSGGADSWLLRPDKASGMPLWAKSLIGDHPGIFGGDELVDVVALPVGLAACGQTAANGTDRDIWVSQMNCDGYLDFLPDSGLVCQCTDVEWRRLDAEHSVHPLTPTAVAIAVAVDAGAVLETQPASAVGHLLTD